MSRIVAGDPYVVKAERAYRGNNIVFFNPAMKVVHPAAKCLVLPSAMITPCMQMHGDAAKHPCLWLPDKSFSPVIARQHRIRIVIMRPDKYGVRPRGHQLKQPQRVRHMVEN